MSLAALPNIDAVRIGFSRGFHLFVDTAGLQARSVGRPFWICDARQSRPGQIVGVRTLAPVELLTEIQATSISTARSCANYHSFPTRCCYPRISRSCLLQQTAAAHAKLTGSHTRNMRDSMHLLPVFRARNQLGDKFRAVPHRS
jgi:hypothetical protein